MGTGPLSMNVFIDDQADVLTVHGVRVHGDLFRALAEVTPEGRWMRVIKTEGGVSTVEVRVDLIVDPNWGK